MPFGFSLRRAAMKSTTCFAGDLLPMCENEPDVEKVREATRPWLLLLYPRKASSLESQHGSVGEDVVWQETSL